METRRAKLTLSETVVESNHERPIKYVDSSANQDSASGAAGILVNNTS